MFPQRSLSLLLVLILSIFSITAFSTPAKRRSDPDPEQFRALLSFAADADIHEVLHRFDSRFRDGVFNRDRTAMEVVHGEDPAMATELVKLALNKRQISNTTTTPAPATTADAPTTPTAQDGGPPAQTTASDVRTSVLSPSSPAGASAVSSTSGAVIYSKSGGGLTTAHSSTALLRPSTTTVRRTTTLPDGQVSVITSVAVVDAAFTTLSTDTAIAAATGTGSEPSLQSGGASSLDGMVGAKMGAIAGFAAAILAM